MTHPTAVINVVGLSRSLLEHAPRIRALARRGVTASLSPVLPAVTCTVQSSMLTGLTPGAGASGEADRLAADPSTSSTSAGHGIVGNGWYDRQTCEVRFWQRSNRLVHGEKVWDAARRRDPSLTCANLFWWYNSYSTCDYLVQARPTYKADGRKIPDCFAQPLDLRDLLQADPPEGLGPFPLFHFWGPLANIQASRWIADAAMWIHRRHAPTLTMIYLPHLDYALQKLGPGHPDVPAQVAQIDEVVAGLLDYFDPHGVRVILLSEYGIEPAAAGDGAVYINRVLREAGLLRVRVEQGLELLEPGGSDAFAVVDHQLAHVYLNGPTESGGGGSGGGGSMHADLLSLLRNTPGVEQVLDRAAQGRVGLDHPRSGDLVLVAEPGRWFTYDHWLDDRRAPDFARTVDIHRKPGYDPRELFSDKGAAAVAWKLLKRKLGFRQLLDVVPLDTSLVRGTHGRTSNPPELQPMLILPSEAALPDQQAPATDPLPCTAVRDVILGTLFDD